MTISVGGTESVREVSGSERWRAYTWGARALQRGSVYLLAVFGLQNRAMVMRSLIEYRCSRSSLAAAISAEQSSCIPS